MWERLSTWIKLLEKPSIILVSSLLLTCFLLSLDFNFLEANLYDLRMSRGLKNKANSNIVLITLDDITSKEFGEFAPLSLDYHARFLESLEKLEPRAIGYLVDMNHIKQANPDQFNEVWSQRFVSAAERMMSRGTSFLLGTPYDVTGEILPPAALQVLPHSVAVIHKDGNIFSEDKITRSALLTLSNRPAFHLDLVYRLNLLGKGELPRGSFYVPQIDGNYFFFRYHESTLLCKKWPCRLPYSTFSFADILNQRIPTQRWTDKIALVGTLSSFESGDFALTPYSKTPFTNPKLLVHANILDSIIKKDGIVPVPKAINGLITFVVTAIVLRWIMTSTPLYGVFATLSLALAFILISQAIFQVRGLWVRESQPLVGIFVSYYLAVPYRLIREYKKRWEYQQKNELLTRVEELKTNFLSLVTHDLKTPVARIQGLTEVLLRNTSKGWLPADQETLRHIVTSTEDLNHFISNILELGKLESNRLPLKFESRDVNQLIERSVEMLKPQARARRIEVQCRLEPLFPTKLDASLISKVLNTLIDNAIKYSPPHSRITVSSFEKGNSLVISVEDQGIGMTSEEQECLFTRFYRAKNEATSTIPGTGLGLYLTKYFIEAHRGRVEVESEKNRGSVFRIFLPIIDTIQERETPC